MLKLKTTYEKPGVIIVGVYYIKERKFKTGKQY